MSDEFEEKRKNKLNTKIFPPIFMLGGGLISLIVCCIFNYEIDQLLLVTFITLLIFSIIGLIVKMIVDSFNMELDYEDVLNMEEGAIMDKGNKD